MLALRVMLVQLAHKEFKVQPEQLVLKVIRVTTNAVAKPDAQFSGTPWASNQNEKSSLKAASPTMPFSTPIDVMPICTVDKNCVGCAIKRSAACAPVSPASANAAKRALRLEDSAISDMANKPFKKVKKTISNTSIKLGFSA